MRILALVAFTLVTQIAFADHATDGRKAFAEGRDLYAKGSYVAAAERFARAFASDPDPAYIFNVGQSYRRSAEDKAGVLARDCRRSAEAYKKFLTLVAAPSNKSEIATYIKDMESCAGSYVEVMEPKPIDTPIDTPIDKPIDKPIDTPVRVSAGGSMKLTGLVVAAVGAIGIGIGAYSGLESLRILDDRKELLAMPMPPAKAAIDLDDRGHRANVRTYAGLIGGGLLVTTGALLYIVGRNQARERTRITVAPAGRGVVAAFQF